VSEDLAAQVALACRVLGKLDATHSTLGHVSCRADQDTMLIRGKGPDEHGLRDTGTDDVIRVSFEVEMIDGRDGLRPPSESFLHAWLYRLRPEVQTVIHMHPEAAVLLTVCGRELRPVYGSYSPGGAALAVEGVPTYDSSVTISSHDRGRDFAGFMGSRRAALMRGHGAAVAGGSLEEAAVTMMALKELADFTYKALLIGEPLPLPQAEADEVGTLSRPDRPYGSAGGRTGLLSTWRNYQVLAGEL
jgi:ribulose-5-phosphate 4-epimerase/fuculose-1-phosphate aldolase